MSDQSSDEGSDLLLQISSSAEEEDENYETEDDVDSYIEKSQDVSSAVKTTVGNTSSEWIEFNKKVISMRPLFKSAKVQFVHKASRTIKTLKKKKGTPEQVERNNKKAERLAHEISYINSLKKDVVAKFALLHSKEEIIKIVNSADSTMEYRAKAKVASTPKILKAAEEYHLEHPDWRDSLYKLIQLAGKNMKKKRRKMRGKTSKGKKNSDASRGFPKKQDDDFDRFGEDNFPEPPPGLEDPMEKDGNSEEESHSESEEVDDDEQQSESNDDFEDFGMIMKIPNKETAEHKLASNDIMSDKPVEKKRKLRNESRVENPRSKQKVSTTKLVPSKNPVDEDADRPSKPRSNVDPFFITSDNKEYKTLWKVEPADSFKSKKPNEPEFMFKNARPFKDVVKGKSQKRPPKVVKNDRNSKNNEGSGKPVAVEDLHPSWQAKKKINVNVAFQGKKVVFED